MAALTQVIVVGAQHEVGTVGVGSAVLLPILEQADHVVTGAPLALHLDIDAQRQVRDLEAGDVWVAAVQRRLRAQ